MKQLLPPMSSFALAPVLALALAAPAPAQDDPAPMPEVQDEGFSLMEEGARLMLRGLMTEMAPAITDLEALMRELGPELDNFAGDVARAMVTLVDLIDDVKHYDAPVILDNGDIIMRRRADAPPYIPRDQPQEEEEAIDL